MEILNYFESGSKEYLLSQIEQCDWSAAAFLAKIIKENRFDEILGSDGSLFVMTDGEKLVSFCTLTRRDCIKDESLYPWIGFVFTAPEYRGRRYSGKIIAHACAKAKKQGFDMVYLSTDHVGLYEKYGFVYMENRTDVWGEDSRIYYRDI